VPTPREVAHPIAAIISLLRPHTVVAKTVSGAGEWSVRKPRYADPAFCLQLEGWCHLDVDGIGGFELQQGDFLLFPSTPGFTLASDLRLDPVFQDFDPSSETRHGTVSGPATMRMLGGYFGFRDAHAHLILRLMPRVVHIRHDEAGAARVRRVVALIEDEAGGERPGRDLILERLVEVLLTEAIRYRSAVPTREEQGLLAGLSDPEIAKALQAIHDHVGGQWTVERLARRAGLSRAVFAERFVRLIGMPPMHYVLEWRVALAKDLLHGNQYSQAEVAERVGYQSASAFSTAFSRVTGHPPGHFARTVPRHQT
jgi:AraC-like DNA-binding protein